MQIHSYHPLKAESLQLQRLRAERDQLLSSCDLLKEQLRQERITVSNLKLRIMQISIAQLKAEQTLKQLREERLQQLLNSYKKIKK